jgi:antitoxin (DNA-binding transcriptional repressor) of toxin-antitoxin stability system
MLLTKRSKPVVKLSAPDQSVEAISDLQFGRRWVRKGTRLARRDPLVVAHPEVFEVRYRLSEEVSDAR